MRLIVVLLFLATLLSTSHARVSFFNPIQLLSSAASRRDGDISYCLSWRLTVETHNRQGKNTLVPQSCAEYVRQYMLNGQYAADCEEVANVAIEYAKSVKPAEDEKDVWVFDIDETTLSNLPYYERPDVQFGSLRPPDNSKFYEWVEKGEAKPVPGMLHLYSTVLLQKFKTVILTGLSDAYKSTRERNLKEVGYDNWEKLIFKDEKTPTAKFKSEQRTKLVKEGYRIVGNVGDQWVDLSGANVGNRTFKVPNPMYYS